MAYTALDRALEEIRFESSSSNHRKSITTARSDFYLRAVKDGKVSAVQMDFTSPHLQHIDNPDTILNLVEALDKGECRSLLLKTEALKDGPVTVECLKVLGGDSDLLPKSPPQCCEVLVEFVPDVPRCRSWLGPVPAIS